jgi:hypothetical protein
MKDAENGGGLAYDDLAVVPDRVPVRYQTRTCCAQRTNVNGFDVPEHNGDGFGLASARPKRQSQPRNLVIGWMPA